MSNTPSRRQFLAASASFGLGLPILSSRQVTLPQRAPSHRDKLHILIIGGTGHLGPFTVEAARAAGHEVTLFNRGRTDPSLFPDLPHIEGDRTRPADVEKLKGLRFDAVIDNVAYFPRDVTLVAEALAGRIEQYLLVSSVSVYPKFGTNQETVHEGTATAVLRDEDKEARQITGANYGALKRACEEAAEQVFPGKCTQVRPGYIVGPRDRSDRFTYWPRRVARGGEILAPGNPDVEFQVVDVRDLGHFLIQLVSTRNHGIFNAVGYRGRYSIQEMLHGAKCLLNEEASFTWVDDAFLKQHKVTSWGDLPYTPEASYGHIDNRRAIDAGHRFRPLGETVKDTYDWTLTLPGDRRWRAGMAPEREVELLAAFKSR